MMSRYHHHVLCPHILGQLRPFLHIAVLTGKFIRQLRILFLRNVLIKSHPFASSQNRVKSPVNEHPYLSIPPPLLLFRRQGELLAFESAQAFEIDTALEHRFQFRASHFSWHLFGIHSCSSS